MCTDIISLRYKGWKQIGEKKKRRVQLYGQKQGTENEREKEKNRKKGRVRERGRRKDRVRGRKRENSLA